MPKYLLVMWGSGEGCDYTIACNKNALALASDTLEEAIKEAKTVITPAEPDRFDWDENKPPYYLSTAMVVEKVADLNVEEIYDYCRRQTATRKSGDKEAKERAELERLKRKYEQTS